jgi:Tfp pilus assembly protein PilF
MSLLLDARKKQLAQGGHDKCTGLELSLEEQPTPAMAAPDMQPIRNILSTEKDLFGKKSSSPSASRMGINRNILFALCGTIVMLAAGAGYYWHDGSMGSAPLPHSDASAPLLKPAPSTAQTKPQTRNTLATKTAFANSAYSVTKPLLAVITPPVKNKTPPALAPLENSAIRIERNKTGFTDPLLNNAYLAYRNGNLEAAQQLYRELLDGDERNTDALLGLAVIAQQRGENMLSSQYYSRALTLDPQNAVANAGMSVLTAESSSENRLKILLDENKESAILHFALGNRYAEQSSWGEAQQAYFNACTLEPGNAEFTFNLAVSLDHLGQKKLASQYYQRALELDQTDGDQEHPQKLDDAQTRQRIRELTR